jgi:hypothetical protein
MYESNKKILEILASRQCKVCMSGCYAIRLCNTLTTLLRLMNYVLPMYLDSFFIFYLDDILVYSATWEEHISHLMKVLYTLKKHQLLANFKKCEFD